MEFVKADSLKKQFEVKGSFYHLKIQGHSFECRNYAQVYRKDKENQKEYDAIFVLMNPGLCSPKKSTYLIPQISHGESSLNYTYAKTDNTQYQIMRFMNLKNWNKVLVINLSDIRAGNLDEFKRKLNDAKRVGFEGHSIFSEQRKDELGQVLSNSNCPIIVAWGTDSRFKNLAECALAALPQERIIGVEHNNKPFYYHASPTPLKGKVEWLQHMNEIIAG
ncbi:DUF1643 domain-containing protein [Mesobacillus maritimus]|uniref:DUF1643 domain-containing protein n=1 Tax=Mesobacillus maritimus TaxID=1643336 RepID=UPI00203DAFD3|nr:DUF1643 domain-containing protein [Mesobacillus maritimus]MCM3671003.1 DUF1643 domain-containing protein [Mesobacillus maritimus]